MAGGNLPFGFAPSGSLTNYTPTLREKATDWLRTKLFSDDRAGQGRAEKVMDVAQFTPFGFGVDMYDAGREIGQGNLGAAALNMAVVPFGVAAKTPIKRAALELNETLRRAVPNTSGSRLTDEGLAMRVSRSQMPDQEMSESVRGGVFYLPDGAAQAKHYSTGKNGYGGPQKVAGETLFKNPLVVKGATGGKAPEAALDSIAGKGSYQSVRDEALKAIGYGKRDYEQIERVEMFLDKHAPELSGLGQYIIDNSGKGNQLAYALQEAAVASAARKAGFDGIVGYSTSTKTKEPFLSEVFDVRENRYPSPTGDYSMWPEFYPPERGQ